MAIQIDNQLTILKKPRLLAGFLSGFGYVALLAKAGHQYSIAFAIPTIWFTGLLVGGKYPFFVSLWRNKAETPDYRLRWGGAFWGGLIAAFIGSIILVRANRLGITFGALAPSFSLCYGLSKLGCWKFSCCDWSHDKENSLLRPSLALPLTEAVLSILLVGILLIPHNSEQSLLISFCLFLIFHGSLRCVSVRGQGRCESNIKVLFRHDSGLIVVTGVLLWLCLTFVLRS